MALPLVCCYLIISDERYIARRCGDGGGRRSKVKGSLKALRVEIQATCDWGEASGVIRTPANEGDVRTGFKIFLVDTLTSGSGLHNKSPRFDSENHSQSN